MPFQFIIYFHPKGLFVEGLTQGSTGIVIDGLKSIGSRPAKEDCTISIDKLEIYLYVYASVRERCGYLFEGHQENSDLAMTTLNTFFTCTLPLKEVTNHIH